MEGDEIDFEPLKEFNKYLVEGAREIERIGKEMDRIARKEKIATIDHERVNVLPIGKREAIENFYQSLIYVIDSTINRLDGAKIFPLEKGYDRYFSLANEIEPVRDTIVAFKKLLKEEQSKIKLGREGGQNAENK